MERPVVIVACLLAVVAGSPVCAQQVNTASERERIGKERARIEAERRAREMEPEVLVEEAVPEEIKPPLAAPEPPPRTVSSAAPAAITPAEGADSHAKEGSAGAGEISQVLEQLRELGELRDAGYVTDEEFDRIKRRILETGF